MGLYKQTEILQRNSYVLKQNIGKKRYKMYTHEKKIETIKPYLIASFLSLFKLLIISENLIVHPDLERQMSHVLIHM